MDAHPTQKWDSHHYLFVLLVFLICLITLPRKKNITNFFSRIKKMTLVEKSVDIFWIPSEIIKFATFLKLYILDENIIY